MIIIGLSSGNGVGYNNEVTLRQARLVLHASMPSLVCNQSLRPTQPPILSGTGNEYQPRSCAAGKITVGLASRWPGVTDSGYIRAQWPKERRRTHALHCCKECGSLFHNTKRTSELCSRKSSQSRTTSVSLTTCPTSRSSVA